MVSKWSSSSPQSCGKDDLYLWQWRTDVSLRLNQLWPMFPSWWSKCHECKWENNDTWVLWGLKHRGTWWGRTLSKSSVYEKQRRYVHATWLRRWSLKHESLGDPILKNRVSSLVWHWGSHGGFVLNYHDLYQAMVVLVPPQPGLTNVCAHMSLRLISSSTCLNCRIAFLRHE